MSGHCVSLPNINTQQNHPEVADFAPATLNAADSKKLSGLVRTLCDDATVSQQFLTQMNDFLASCLASDHSYEQILDSPSKLYAPSFSFNEEIKMALCGEVVTYRLDMLEPDPQAIITLLLLTSSDVGCWMAVAAHYRRTDNPRAAIAVMLAMIHAMQKKGIPECNMSPSFIMLASCEADLSKLLQSSDKAQHIQNAQQWLQKAFPQSASTSRPFSSLINQPSTRESHLDRTPKASSETPYKSDRHQQHCSPTLNNNNNGDPHTVSPAPKDNRRHVPILEREIRSLRDRLNHQSRLLDNNRALQRKLEDQLSDERSRSKRLEKRMESLQRDVDASRRMEKYATERQRREVDLRKKTEERERQERERRVQLEQELKLKADRQGPSNILDLANMLQQVADRYA